MTFDAVAAMLQSGHCPAPDGSVLPSGSGAAPACFAVRTSPVSAAAPTYTVCSVTAYQPSFSYYDYQHYRVTGSVDVVCNASVLQIQNTATVRSATVLADRTPVVYDKVGYPDRRSNDYESFASVGGLCNTLGLGTPSCEGAFQTLGDTIITFSNPENLLVPGPGCVVSDYEIASTLECKSSSLVRPGPVISI
ncbi:MAG: hypothetical protein LC789_14515 [Actinobacteria bacterium]|nr:hypothetical protein [Actinomycetota bacterium]MCA1721320.1 hypothetical protein [Actinomycetota bacterium]